MLGRSLRSLPTAQARGRPVPGASCPLSPPPRGLAAPSPASAQRPPQTPQVRTHLRPPLPRGGWCHPRCSWPGRQALPGRGAAAAGDAQWVYGERGAARRVSLRAGDLTGLPRAPRPALFPSARSLSGGGGGGSSPARRRSPAGRGGARGGQCQLLSPACSAEPARSVQAGVQWGEGAAAAEGGVPPPVAGGGSVPPPPPPSVSSRNCARRG